MTNVRLRLQPVQEHCPPLYSYSVACELQDSLQPGIPLQTVGEDRWRRNFRAGRSAGCSNCGRLPRRIRNSPINPLRNRVSTKLRVRRPLPPAHITRFPYSPAWNRARRRDALPAIVSSRARRRSCRCRHVILHIAPAASNITKIAASDPAGAAKSAWCMASGKALKSVAPVGAALTTGDCKTCINPGLRPRSASGTLFGLGGRKNSRARPVAAVT